MIREYSALAHCPLQAGAGFVRPKHKFPARVEAEDPALAVMTDLHKTSVVTVRLGTAMDKANERMIRYGVRMLVVLGDADADAVVGLLTANDVLGEKPVRHLHVMGGTHADIRVADIMTPLREIEALPIEAVREAKVGQIIATLKHAGRQHALVVEQDGTGQQALCGLFSLTQIARQMGVQTEGFDLNRLFADIDARLRQS